MNGRSVRNLFAAALLLGAVAREEAPAVVAQVQSGPSTTAAPAVAGPATMYMMSAQQYRAAITHVFGRDINNTASLPPLLRSDGLVAVGAGTALVTPGALEVFEQSARAIAAQVVNERHRGVLIPCKPADTRAADDACAREYLGSVGRLLFRRPLSADELNVQVKTARDATNTVKNFYTGLGYALAGILTAPQFIYFVEDAEPDPDHPGQLRLDAFSKATRLSLLLWNSLPDDLLLKAAESGEIHTQAGLKRHVDRMLASPRVKDGVRAFFEDMLVLEAFADVSKDPTIYPAYSQLVAGQAKEQTLRIIEDHLVTRNADYRDLFTTRNVFLTADLGPVYNVPVNTSEPMGWLPYQLPEDDPRAGILTQVGFLSVYAHPGRSSATRRGKGVREVFMCQKVPDPPPNVDFSAIETPDPNIRTARERLDVHRKNPTCAGCHRLTDPIGLALENFDGAGQFRELEKGAPIDASGSFDGRAFANAKELGQAVHDNPAINSCVVRRLYQYAVRHPLAEADKALVADLLNDFTRNDYRFVELMRSLATKSEFYRVANVTTSDASLVQ